MNNDERNKYNKLREKYDILKRNYNKLQEKYDNIKYDDEKDDEKDFYFKIKKMTDALELFDNVLQKVTVMDKNKKR